MTIIEIFRKILLKTKKNMYCVLPKLFSKYEKVSKI